MVQPQPTRLREAELEYLYWKLDELYLETSEKTGEILVTEDRIQELLRGEQ